MADPSASTAAASPKHLEQPDLTDILDQQPDDGADIFDSLAKEDEDEDLDETSAPNPESVEEDLDETSAPNPESVEKESEDTSDRQVDEEVGNSTKQAGSGSTAQEETTPRVESTEDKSSVAEKTPALDDLFAGEDDSADPFAQLAEKSDTGEIAASSLEEPRPETTQEQRPSPEDDVEEHPTSQTVVDASQEDEREENTFSKAQDSTLNSIFQAEDQSDDPFASIIGQSSDAQTSPTIEEEGSGGVNHSIAAVEGETPANPSEKDFSDLLAEFDGDLGADQAGEDPSRHTEDAAIRASDLVHDDTGPSVFDNLGEANQSQPESPVPNLSIENSMVQPSPGRANQGHASMHSSSESSDWMADTTMDESFARPSGRDSFSAGIPSGHGPDDGGDPIPFEVPQGWYDDDGNWNWYTEQEREEVRLAMMGQGGFSGAEASNKPATELGMPPYTPGLGPAASENAARRTPQPDENVRAPAANTYDTYAPPSTAYQPSSATSFATSSSGYITTSSPYNTQSTQSQASPYAPASYDPYAPSSSTRTAGPAYGNVAQSYGSSSAPPSATRGPVKSADRPAPPQRVASNAYDPPFLKPKKSFVRPPSAMSMAPSGFSAPQAAPTPPQPAAPAPPPAGPPRRAKTPSAAPSFAPPPVSRRESSSSVGQSPAQAITQPSQAQSQSDPYAPSDPYQRPPSQPAVTSPPQQAKPPPRNQSYNSFDPPLRPSSAAKARPIPGPERTSTPPIASLAPPPATAPAGPPRGPSRGSLRKPSPMFEQRPIIEERPPSRTSLAVGSGQSPLVAPAEIPSRPSSVAQTQPPRPAYTPVRAPSQIDLDPEGGMQEGDQSSYSGMQQPSARSDYAAEEMTSAEQVEDEPASIKNDESQEDFGYQPPQQPGYEQSPYKVNSQARPRSPVRKDSAQTPTQDAYAPSSYDPSPYQPQDRSQSGQNSYQPEGNQSSGLGLQTMGSPPSEPRSMYNPYAPSTSHDQTSYSPYAPVDINRAGDHSRQSSTYDPYGPSSQSAMLNPSDAYNRPDVSSSYGSDMGTSPPQQSYFQNMHIASDTTYTPQQVLDQRPIAEDPLGRTTLTARNAPIAVFGFGGVLVTGFPALADSDTPVGHRRTPSYGYASGRGQLWIRTVSDLASTSALKPNDNVFPGPLVSDPSSAKGAAGDKKKREAVMAYLEARAEEIEKGLPYLKSSASQARREEEGKLVLVRLLAAMVLGDGKLSGKSEVEEAARNAFSTSSSSAPPTLVSAISMTQNAQSGYSGDQHVSNRAGPQDLTELGSLLARGDKTEAAQYASRKGLWAHALLISSSVGQELWSEMVMRFSEAELQNAQNAAAIKASYAVFSGKTASSVDDLMSAINLTSDSEQDQWREVISSVVFNGKPTDLACLDELGARLRKAGLVYAAHICQLLSPTSPFSDSAPSALDRPIALTQNSRDEDSIIFAEVAEYARGLGTLPRGQELPKLLPYKLQRAWLAAELGDIDLAKRYCTAVETAAKLPKGAGSLLSPALAASLEDLNERLTGTPSANPARLIGGRKSKAGLGSWIEGRLTKFIAGEENGSEASRPPPAAADANAGGSVGPFSHFSTISPAASGSLSRNPSTADLVASKRNSPMMSQSQWGLPAEDQQVASSYGDQYTPSGGSGYNAWSGSQEPPQEAEEEQPSAEDDEADFINPMAALSIGGPRGNGPSDYQPQSQTDRHVDDDDEDLGFGNTSLSRGRTPRPAVDGAAPAKEEKSGKAAPAKEEKAQPAANASLGKPEQKSGWLRGWFGKKDGEGSGPVVAKLGEESSMVFDKELGRWITKGQKPEAAPAAAPPPPPRAQTASPAQAPRPNAGNRAQSATPPPAQPGRNGPPPGMPRSTTAPMGFTETPAGGIKRQKSSLAESITADQAGLTPMSSATPPAAGEGTLPPGPPAGGPPKPPSRSTTASIDDLLSRPPSKRPGSSAKKPMRNRYVDVLTPGTGQ